MDIGSLTGKITLEDQMSVVLTKANEALTKFGESATAQAEKIASTDKSMQGWGKTLTEVGKGLTYLSVPIAAFGAAAMAAGYTVEGAYNTIARKTGETGEALQGLKKDFEVVFGSVPNNAQEVASVLADVHQRLGLTGSELQGVTKKFLDFANVNQTDVASSTRNVIQLMGALSENTNLTAEEIGNASSIMDKLTFAAQSSGASVDKLAYGLTQGGRAMQLLGFNFDESLALFAQFEKVGANVTDVTSSMHKVLTDLAKTGVKDLGAAFKSMVDQIKNASDDAEAIDLSRKLFGAKSGSKLAEEIRGGTYEISEMAKAIHNVGDVTGTTAKNSQSFTESMGELRNQVTLALAPVGVDLINSFKSMIPQIAEAVKILASLVKMFSDLPGPVKTAAFAIAGIATIIGPALTALGTLYGWYTKIVVFTPTLNAAIISTQAALTPFFAMVASGAIVVGSLAAVVTAGYQAFKLWQENRERGTAAEKQAVIDAENLVRVNKTLGQSFKTMDEATAWMTKNNVAKFLRETSTGVEETVPGVKKLTTSNGEAAESYDQLREKMQSMQKEALQPLSAEIKKKIKDLKDWGYTVDEAAKALTGVAEPAIKRYYAALDDGEKASKKASEEMEKLNEWIKEQNREWSRLSPSAFKATKEVTEAAERMSKTIIDNALAQKTAQDELNELTYKSMTDRTTYELHQLEVQRYNAKNALEKNIEDYEGYLRAKAAIDALYDKKKSDLQYAQEQDSASAIFTGLGDKGVAKWKTSIGAIGAAFGDMFEGVNTKVAQVFKVMGSGLDFIVTKAKSTGEQMSAAFSMAASVLSSMLGEGGGGIVGQGAVGALSGAGMGAMIGTTVLPGLGTAAGAGIGAAIGGITSMIGKFMGDAKKMREENAKADKSLEDLRDGLLKTYGSMDNLEATSQRLFGESMIAEWGHKGVKGLQQFQGVVDSFNERMKQVQEATNRIVTGTSAVVDVMTAPWMKFGDTMEAAKKKTEEAEQAIFKAQGTNVLYAQGSTAELQKLYDAFHAASAAEQELYEQQGVMAEQSKQSLSDLTTQALASFAAVYAATGSYAQALEAVAPSVTKLSESYKALGIESDNVLFKNLAIQSQVLESSPQLIAAIDGQAGAMQGMAQMGLLNAESFAAMQRTAMDLYLRLQAETANAAAASGDLGDQSRNALVPMQSYLQQAAKQAELLGLPLDANTQMLIDQSKELGIWQEAGVTAQDKLIKGMDGIVTKLDEMLTKLGGITSSLVSMPDADSTVTVTHIDKYQSVFLPDVHEGDGSQNRAGGGVIVQNYAGGAEFVPHGSDTVPAMLTPGERVLTTQENKAYTADKEQSQNTEKLERTLDGIRQDLRRNNDTLLISLQSMLEHAVA